MAIGTISGDIVLRHIKLTKGLVTIVDNKDGYALQRFKWFAKEVMPQCFYAARSVRNGSKNKTEYMHRIITDCPSDMTVDHIDGDSLNNRRENLRICTRAENQKYHCNHY